MTTAPSVRRKISPHRRKRACSATRRERWRARRNSLFARAPSSAGMGRARGWFVPIAADGPAAPAASVRPGPSSQLTPLSRKSRSLRHSTRWRNRARWAHARLTAPSTATHATTYCNSGTGTVSRNTAYLYYPSVLDTMTIAFYAVIRFRPVDPVSKLKLFLRFTGAIREVKFGIFIRLIFNYFGFKLVTSRKFSTIWIDLFWSGRAASPSLPDGHYVVPSTPISCSKVPPFKKAFMKKNRIETAIISLLELGRPKRLEQAFKFNVPSPRPEYPSPVVIFVNESF